MRYKLNRKHIPVIILAFFGLLIIFIGMANHYLFKTFTYDYANYNFAFWDYSHFRISQLPTFRGTFLQDHFSFTLMYFIPVYWLLNWLTGSYTLIIIQNALILAAAWYSHKLIKLKTGNIWLTSGVILYYFLLFGRYSSFGTDVNLAIMSACFVPIFLYYFEIRKFGISFIILILSLLSRENMPLWFIFIYIVLILNSPKDKKVVLYSVTGIVVSVVYFILLFKVFIPAIETPGVEYALFNYSALGETPGEAVSFILRNPVEAIRMFFVNHLDNPEYDKVKLEFYMVYLFSGGFVLLTRPQYLIWFIPLVAQKVLNDGYFRWGIATYYSVEVVTLLPLSVFLALSSFKRKKLQTVMAILTCAATLGMTIYKMDGNNHIVPSTFYKQKIKFYSKEFYKTPFDVRKVNRLLRTIPGNAKVSASNLITPHLAQRQFIYFFPTVNDAEYLVFSLFDNNYMMSAEENDKHRNYYLNSPDWRIIGKEYPVFVLKKVQPDDPEIYSEYNITTQRDTLYCSFGMTDMLKNHILFSNGQKADTILHLAHDNFRSDSSSICLTPSDPYTHGVSLDRMESLEQLEISVWHYGQEDHAVIVVDNGVNLYSYSNQIDSIDSSGWKRITLITSLTQEQRLPSTIIYLWNAGKTPVWFDDFQIIRRNY
jgi:uncharacterized membrane protein